jgi:hypothetical protein
VGAAELTESLGPPAIDDIPVGHYVPLLEFNPGRQMGAASNACALGSCEDTALDSDERSGSHADDLF